MAITGTGHNGITTFSLEDGILTQVGPGGTFVARIGDKLNDGGIVKDFDAIIGAAKVEYDFFGDVTTKNIAFGELNISMTGFVSKSTTPVHNV